jgi:hypothetical protein
MKMVCFVVVVVVATATARPSVLTRVEFGGSMREPELVRFLSDVSCYILLDDEPAQCKERVELSRGNESESGIPLSYYEVWACVHPINLRLTE